VKADPEPNSKHADEDARAAENTVLAALRDLAARDHIGMRSWANRGSPGQVRPATQPGWVARKADRGHDANSTSPPRLSREVQRDHVDPPGPCRMPGRNAPSPTRNATRPGQDQGHHEL